MTVAHPALPKHCLLHRSLRLATSTSATDIYPISKEQNWLEDNLYVFEGQATDDRDKLHLMLPILGMYAVLYAHQKHGAPSDEARRGTGTSRVHIFREPTALFRPYSVLAARSESLPCRLPQA